MRANFMQFVGPRPGEPEAYREPEGAEPLQEPDASTVSEIRHKLAIRQAKQFDEERANVRKA